MQLKLMVITQKHDTWPARGDRPAGESYIFICQDMSLPAEHRMTENIYYRLKPDEIEKYYNKAMDKILDVVCRSVTISKSGKASLIGEIAEAKK